MTRADLRTFAWLAPLALALAVGWIFWTDGCLDDEFAKYWPARESPAPQFPTKHAGAADEVVIESPYGVAGITNCCFLGNPGQGMSFAILFVIALLIGFLGARSLRQQAGRRAGALTFATLVPVLALDQLTYVPGNRDFFEEYGYQVLIHTALYLFVLALVASATSWLAAALTLQWRRRG